MRSFGWRSSFINVLCFLLFLSSCKLRQKSQVTDETDIKEPKLDFQPHLTLAVPPEDFQIGGKEFFASVKPIAVTHPDLVSMYDQKIYVNQKIDLNLLGPGSNLIFATDGKNWGFAVSNGRFDELAKIGAVENQDYPNRVSWNNPSGDHKNFVEGKYPWPQDKDGNWLSGDKLVTSNSPHGSIENVLTLLTPTNAKQEIMGGHIGIALDGGVYIGYVSGSAKANANKKYESDIAKQQDKRALPFILRKKFHDVLKVATIGRNIQDVVGRVDRSDQEILNGNVKNLNMLARSRHFPEEGSKFNTGMARSSSPFELLRSSLNSQKLDSYIESLSIEKIGFLMSNPVRWKSLFQHERMKNLVRENVNISLTHLLSSPNLLSYAVEMEDVEWVKNLIRLGADVNFGVSGSIVLKSGNSMKLVNQSSPLFNAIQRNNLDIVKELISNGAEVNTADASGITLLSDAVLGGNPRIIQEFLKAGVEVEINEEAVDIASQEIKELIKKYQAHKNEEGPCNDIDRRSR